MNDEKPQFVVSEGEFLFGPFTTAESAYKYAQSRMFAPILIRELRRPKEIDATHVAAHSDLETDAARYRFIRLAVYRGGKGEVCINMDLKLPHTVDDFDAAVDAEIAAEPPIGFEE